MQQGSPPISQQPNAGNTPRGLESSSQASIKKKKSANLTPDVRQHQTKQCAQTKAKASEGRPRVSGVPASPCRGPAPPRGPGGAAGMRASRGGPPRPMPGRAPPPRENAPCWSAAPCSPTAFRRSTIGARGLNFRVRNGTGCASPAMAADQQGAFCCHGRAPVPSGPHSARTPNAPGSRARPRDPGVEEEELGLLVALG